MRTAHISTAARVPRSASSLSLLTCLMTGVVYTPPVLRIISIRNITNMDGEARSPTVLRKIAFRIFDNQTACQK